MELFDFAKSLTLDAGEFIRNRMQDSFEVNTKESPNDLVTEVDKETEIYIRNKIIEKYSDHDIIGEEHESNIESTNGVLWIIDPIDGTMNFVHQLDNFAISIGIFIDGLPYAGFILDVMQNDLYYAKHGEGAFKNGERIQEIRSSEINHSLISMNPKWAVAKNISEPFQQIVKQSRSIRSYGSAALNFAYVATGLIDGAIFYRLEPWDFAGGMIIVNEVSGKTTNLLGEPVGLLKQNSVCVANQTLHEQLITHFKNSSTFIAAHKEKFDSI